MRGPGVLGVPYAVIQHAAGRVICSRAELHALPDAEIAVCAFRLVEVLAELHAVDSAAVGLGEFGRPEGFLDRQVRGGMAS